MSGLARLLVRTTLMLGLLTAGFFVAPLRPADGAWGLRVVVVLGLAVGVGALLRAQITVVRQVADRPLPAIEALLSALYLIILVFAAVYYAMAGHGDQFEGLETRIDALYFALAVVTTVGFGDVYADAQASRAVVSVHLLFNLFFLGTAIRLVSRRADRAEADV